MKRNIFYKNRPFSLFVLTAFLLMQSNLVYAQALPQGATTVSGDVSYTYNGDTLNQVSTTTKSITDWQSANVANGHTWNIIQPSTSSVSLNRVVGGDPSSIAGALNSNGRVFIVNPNGVFFGANSRVDVSGMVASTLDISNSDFLSGNYKFSQNGHSTSVINQGQIHVADGGYVALLSNSVDNSGVILADLGTVILAAGEQITLALDDASRISVTIDEAVKNAVFGPDGQRIKDAVRNNGVIGATGGKVILSGKILNNVFDYAVNNAGIIQAKSLTNQNGTIELVGEGASVIASQGSVITTEGVSPIAKGGNITLRSDKDVVVAKGAILDVSGGVQGGDGGLIDLSAKNKVTTKGDLNGRAVQGYKLGSVIIDPTDASVSGNINADTTVWATNNITIDGDVLLGSGVTLNLFADHSSPLDIDWEDGIGTITKTGNFMVSGDPANIGILNLKAGSGIGSVGSPILVSGLSSVGAELNPTSGTGGIAITGMGARDVNISLATSHNSEINLRSMNSNLILSGDIDAGTAHINLVAPTKGILQLAGSVKAATVNAIALNNITLTQFANRMNLLDARVLGTGNISLYNGRDITLRNVTTDNGYIWVQTQKDFSVGGTLGHITAQNVVAINSTPNLVYGDVFLNSFNGDILVNHISSGANGITHLQSVSGAIQGLAGATANVDASGLIILSSKGVTGTGANNGLRTKVLKLNAVKTNTATSGDINIDNSGTNSLTLTDNYSIAPNFVGALSNYGVTNNNGAINIQNTSTVSVQKDIQTPKGDVTIKTIFPNSDILLEASVYGGFGVGGFGNVNLNAGRNIDQITGRVLTTGDINGMAGSLVPPVNGTITIKDFKAGDDINLNATGDINFKGTADAGGSATVRSDNGSILSDPNGKIIAKDDSSISVPNGTIGLNNPLNVDIQGRLSLDVGKDVAGTSGYLNGVVDSLVDANKPILVPEVITLPPYPPGIVYFNGIPLNAKPLPPVVIPTAPTTVNNPFLTTQLAVSDGNQPYTFPSITQLPILEINSFDRVTSSALSGPVFLYHPLNQLDSSAFDSQFQLDEGAYDFIDGQIERNEKK